MPREKMVGENLREGCLEVVSEHWFESFSNQIIYGI